DIAHFGPVPLDDVITRWKLVDDAGAAVAGGALPLAAIAIGDCQRLGTVAVGLGGLRPARKYTLIVALEGTEFENDWDIWVFADRLDTAAPDDILITEHLDEAALARLGAG